MNMRETLTAYYLGDPVFGSLTPEQAVQWACSRSPDDLPDPGVLAGAVTYQYQRLTTAQVRYVEAGSPSQGEMYERAFRCGVVEILGKGDPWKPSGDDGSRLAFDEAEVGDLVCIAEMRDVGQWIWARSMLGKGVALHLPPPPTSYVAWDAIARRSAASSQA